MERLLILSDRVLRTPPITLLVTLVLQFPALPVMLTRMLATVLVSKATAIAIGAAAPTLAVAVSQAFVAQALVVASVVASLEVVSPL